MSVTIDKAEAFRRMQRVKGWARNGDVLWLMDTLEHCLKCWEPKAANRPQLSRDNTVAANPSPELSRDNVAPGSGKPGRPRAAPACPECAARLAKQRARKHASRGKEAA